MELGLQPVTHRLQTNMLLFWHKLSSMPSSRLPKQVLGVTWQQVGRGRFPDTWNATVNKLLAEHGIDPVAALQLSARSFKTLIRHKLRQAQDSGIQLAVGRGGACADYVNNLAPATACTKPASYLCAGACTRGKELIMQLRVGCLQLRGLVGRYASRQGADVSERTCCPVCASGPETPAHFLLECAGGQQLRGSMMAELRQCAPDRVAAFERMTLEQQRWCLVSESFWEGAPGVQAGLGQGGQGGAEEGEPGSPARRADGSMREHVTGGSVSVGATSGSRSVLPGAQAMKIVEAFVYRAWSARNAVISASSGRGADGGDPVAD